MSFSRATLDGYLMAQTTLASGATPTEKDLFSGPCRVSSIIVSSAVAAFIHLYDNINPTLASTPADFRFSISNTGEQILMLDEPLEFANGFSVAGTNAADESGNLTGNVTVTVRALEGLA